MKAFQGSPPEPPAGGFMALAVRRVQCMPKGGTKTGIYRGNQRPSPSSET